MKAIVPLNIAALRVSNADASGGTSAYAGRTALFEKLPYLSGTAQASTGDQIWRSLIAPAQDSLQQGIHLHWELPEAFKRGRSDPGSGRITFPAAPNRWLVARTLRIWNSTAKAYDPPQATAWVVESDYLTPDPPTRDDHGVLRLPISVPLQADGSSVPYQYQGRVVPAAHWDPDAAPPSNYLPYYRGADGQPLFLTSIGFTGPAFSGYYPECCSVFGFWDCFSDNATVFDAITHGVPIQFAVSYAVTGWLADAGTDPMPAIAAKTRTDYATYVDQCRTERVPVTRTPAQVYNDLAAHDLGWLFADDAIGYTLDGDGNLTALTAPDGAMCAGTLVDTVWNGAGPFLAAPGKSSGWSDTVEIAAGNTTAEAVAALVASQLPQPAGGQEPAILESYETLLEALQLGILRTLESDGNSLVALGRARHDEGFSSVDGGRVWTVRSTAAPGRPSSTELTLPLTLAEQLSLLNNAQQAYDLARERLVTVRQQLFMDWLVYVREYCQTGSANTLSDFLSSSGACELAEVVAAGEQAGIAEFTVDPKTGRTSISTDSAPTTLAGRLVAAHQVVADALAAVPGTGQHPAWELDAVPAPAYWMPTDPVLVIEGKRIEPSRRNGAGSTIGVRTDSELIGQLALTAAAGSWTVDAGQISDLAAVSAAVPAEVSTVLGEAALLDPLRSSELAGLTGASDPAGLGIGLAAAVGGQSPLDPPASPGLFAAVRTAPTRQQNPIQTVGTGADALSVTFTDATKTAYPPDPVGWNTQPALPEFSATRFDPYLPVWMAWTGSLDPLGQSGGSIRSYPGDTVTTQFSLDPTSLDFDYPAPATFTAGSSIRYTGEVVLSKTPMVSMVAQIDGYLDEFAVDSADPELTSARDDLAGKRVMAQTMDTFGLAQTLRQTIPQLPVMDLTQALDIPTSDIADATAATPADNWYDTSLNVLQPIGTGPQALGNFGPLRAGFLELAVLSLVDVFGQRLSLQTATQTSTGALTVRPSGPLSPAAGDTANAAKIYLPPRLLTPTRLEAHWLSASHNDDVPGVGGDFVETSDHPATSPVCGWFVPNHLDLSLMCYDADGAAVGSFQRIGSVLQYQTRAGNLANPHSSLDVDLATVNTHLADLMRFVSVQSAAFLTDLLATIDASNQFIAPGHAPEDVAVSILIGRPLAVVRTALGLSTSGGTLPVSQASAALDRATSESWFSYTDRQAGAGANLGGVDFGVTVGDHSDLDDGLVALLPEGAGASPYSVVYAASAPADAGPVLQQPGPDTVSFTANADQQTFTMLLDPRAGLHITSGILPTTTLQIPPDQYAQAMQQLCVTFTTRPVLGDQFGLRLPLPVEPGYLWSWVGPGAAPVALPISGQPDTPVYGHGPQVLTDGWLMLSPDPQATALNPAALDPTGGGE